jgi:hypothetical protein
VNTGTIRKRAAALIAVVALPAAAVAMFSAPAQAAETSKVSILHGVPGLVVDVYANDKKILSDFKPGTLAGPLDLPAGTYDLAVRKAGDPATAKPAIEANGVAVPGGINATITANLDAAGKPALNVFVNDTSKIAPGKTRLTVRHVAAAPAVDVRAGGSPVFKGLTNPKEVKADLAAGTVKADVVLAGTSTVAIGPASLDLAEGTNTLVYAWGDGKAGYKLAVQTIPGLHSAPGGVPAGDGGAGQAELPAWALGMIAAAGVGVVVSATRLRRARQQV